MSSFLLAFVKLEEFYFRHNLNDKDMIHLLYALIDLCNGQECNPFYVENATKIRSSLPFRELRIDVEILVYNTCIEFLKLFQK